LEASMVTSQILDRQMDHGRLGKRGVRYIS